MSTHNLCFFSKNKKNNVYPCKPQFYYIKVGFKRVKIIKACFRDEVPCPSGHTITGRFYKNSVLKKVKEFYNKKRPS